MPYQKKKSFEKSLRNKSPFRYLSNSIKHELSETWEKQNLRQGIRKIRNLMLIVNRENSSSGVLTFIVSSNYISLYAPECFFSLKGLSGLKILSLYARKRKRLVRVCVSVYVCKRRPGENP